MHSKTPPALPRQATAGSDLRRSSTRRPSSIPFTARAGNSLLLDTMSLCLDTPNLMLPVTRTSSRPGVLVLAARRSVTATLSYRMARLYEMASTNREASSRAHSGTLLRMQCARAETGRSQRGVCQSEKHSSFSNTRAALPVPAPAGYYKPASGFVAGFGTAACSKVKAVLLNSPLPSVVQARRRGL